MNQMGTRMNCWEFMNCGRQPGGERADSAGVCPAATENKLHGIHGGVNAGRACWVVGGTFCKGTAQGTFSQKFRSCEACDFYNDVKKKEFPRFNLSAVLLSKLR